MTQTNGEINTMLMDWKNYLVKFTQGNLPIQYNLYQNTNDITYRTITNNSKICMGTQKTPNSQNNLQKEQRCNYRAP